MNQRIINDITNFMFVNDTPQKSDVILIPGTHHHEITELAAELYHKGLAPYILPSGKYYSLFGHFVNEMVTEPRYMGDFATEFEFAKYILMQNGVPESAILCEDKATNTAENAIFSLDVLKAHNITPGRVILCCQAFHSRRAYMSYARIFTDSEFFVVSTPTQGISRDDWYKTERGYRKIMVELEKCGKYFSELTK